MNTLFTDRAQWMRLFALSEPNALATLFNDLDLTSRVNVIFGPETGILTVRGRVSAQGDAFNAGDACVTKTEVTLDNRIKGFAMTLGASQEKSLHAAGLDAIMQAGANTPTKERILDLHNVLIEKQEQRAAKVNTTKVDFFTMVRGEG